MRVLQNAALLLLLQIAALLVAGCRQDFDPASYVVGLRVLAVKAEPPELAPGETTALSILAVDTRGQMIDYAWARCDVRADVNDPGVSLACVDPDGGSALAPFGGDSAQATFTMPSVTAGDLGIPDYTLGVYQPVRVVASVANRPPDRSEDPVIAFYRVRLATGLEARNTNPVLSSLFAVAGPNIADLGLDSTLPPRAPSKALVPPAPLEHARIGDKIKLRALVDARSIEDFLIVDGDPTQHQFKLVQESPRLLWYATAGTIDEQVTGLDGADTTLELDPKHTPPGTTSVDVWVVAHDERGGSDWIHGTIAVEP